MIVVIDTNCLFVDCSVASGADYLITEDRHFKALETVEFPRIHIRTRSQFEDILGQTL